MNARRRIGAVLATAAVVSLLLWLTRAPQDASARGVAARSSEDAVAPKESVPPPIEADREGSHLTDAAAEPAAPLRLAAEEPQPAAAPADQSAPPATEQAAAATKPAAPPASSGSGLLNIESGQPLSITADELEAIELPDGRRQLLFTRSVNVEQGGLQVRSDRLEAHYAAKATQPERLVANGNVRVRQKARELSCAKATYFPAEERLECVGNARLRDGTNQVDGERIEILFAQDRIRVKGGAVVNVAPEEKKPAAASEAAASSPAPGAGATP